ncbi:MAG: MoxR family ATPase [Candidatus Pacearchaeota archaeon]
MAKPKIRDTFIDEEAKLKKKLEDLERKYRGEPAEDKFVQEIERDPISEVIPADTSNPKKSEENSKPEFESYEEEYEDEDEEYPEEEKKAPLENVKLIEPVSIKIKPVQIKLKGDPRPSEAEVQRIADAIYKIKKEISKVLIGQEEIVDGLIRGLICNGHVLLEGIPGIAKTLSIRALGAVSGCDVKRVQFTVDLLPTDITGITSYTPQKGFEVIKGPIFANFLIADEINRSPPKTQSALIEGMQEKQVTIGKENFSLPNPFFVMATENPLENAGVYPLPEAQIDRFLFKLIMSYPKEEEERVIMENNMTLQKFENFNIKPVIKPKDILHMQEIVKKVYLDNSIKTYILEIVKRTRNKKFQDSEYLAYGASPRASIALFIASKAKALMEGRNYVIPEDVKKIAYDVLRHRLILSYKATLKNINPDDLIRNILNEIKV